jgi:hypothetical protein
VLTQAQRRTLRGIFDGDEGLEIEITGPLAAYLALFNICGPRTLAVRVPRTSLSADIFSVWAATGPDLKAVLKRDGECVVCPELATRYPVAA